MKFCIVVLLIVGSFGVFAQGTILNISIQPTNPVATDTIFVYADLSFTSSSCELDQSYSNIIGNTIQAGTQHCLGAASAICYITDTFKINPLPGGNYSFDLTLSSGQSPAPCTPGIVADDTASFSFNVDSVTTTAINEVNSFLIEMYPNPSQGQLTIKNKSNIKNIETLVIYNIEGRELIRKSYAEELSLDLLPGVYLVKFLSRKQVIALKKLMIARN